MEKPFPIDPLVSVVLPAYNCEKFIEQSIRSILDQSHSNIELLVSDDSSTDGTKEIIDSIKDGRLRVLHNNKNMGYLKTCNKLFGASKGDFITFQDADDWSHPERIRKQLSVFESSPKIGICGTNLQVVDEYGNYIRSHIKNEDPNTIAQDIVNKNQFGGPTVMYPRYVYEKIGGYREFFDIGSEDYDLYYRIVEEFQGYNIQQDLYYYREIEDSMTTTVKIDKAISADLVRFFGQQRQEYGKDDLQISRNDRIEKQISILEKPYLEDPSLILHQYAALFNYKKLNKKAIKTSINAIRKEPSKFKNYKLLAYCLKLFIKEKILKL